MGEFAFAKVNTSPPPMHISKSLGIEKAFIANINMIHIVTSYLAMNSRRSEMMVSEQVSTA